MNRLMIAAALAFAPVAAHAQADGVVSATPGALAGRSPHHAFRLTTGTTSCPAAMHSLPGGKLPVYGATHIARPGCGEPMRIADAGSSTVRASR